MRETNIHIKIALDEKNVPTNINWEASDAPVKGEKSCKAFMLALWDDTQQTALRIDLWKPDMTHEEMNHFLFQTLMTMSDSYKRATQNADIASDLQQAAIKFAQKAGVLKK